MTPADFVPLVLDPGLAFLDRVGGISSDNRARLLVLSSACQESGLEARRQVEGTARGWWQFERAGAVRGVLNHPQSAQAAAKVCAELCIPTDEATVYEALAWSDTLSVAFARLLLWTDPMELPELGAIDDAYSGYIRCWRPGKPSRERWTSSYQDASGVICPPVAPTSSIKERLHRLVRLVRS
jgi:hypothetical protein